MGLKSTWWIADEREPECDLCKNEGCKECDPDYEVQVECEECKDEGCPGCDDEYYDPTPYDYAEAVRRYGIRGKHY